MVHHFINNIKDYIVKGGAGAAANNGAAAPAGNSKVYMPTATRA